MPERFHHEDVSAVPSGWKVRTVKHGDHLVRVAFPPGRRRTGSGRLVSILHPRGENPMCGIRSSNPAELLVMSANPPASRRNEPFTDYEMRELTQLWHTARIPLGGAASRYERLKWVAKEWEKAHPGQRLKAYKALEHSTHGYGNPGILDVIKHGDRVTIVNRFGQHSTGRAVMRGPHGWVLNMGGAHGTPAVATEENIIKVKQSKNPGSKRYPSKFWKTYFKTQAGLSPAQAEMALKLHRKSSSPETAIHLAKQRVPNPGHEARELYLYIKNTENLWMRQGEAIRKNLLRKYRKGKYSHDLAPKLWKYLADNAAKQYCREFGCTKAQVFPKPVLEETAKQLADEYYEDLKAGTDLPENPAWRIPENPRDASSVFSKAAGMGYPYLRGEGRVAADGRTWLSRVTKHSDGSGPAMFIGWDHQTRKWVIEEEGENPRRSGETTFGDLAIGDTFDFISGTMYDSFYKRVKKTGPRTYEDEEGGKYRIGSLSAKVYHVERAGGGNPSIKVGDRVRYSVAFLRSTGQYAGTAPHAKGTVTALSKLGADTTLATIDWGGADLPDRVNVHNLTVVGSSKERLESMNPDFNEATVQRLIQIHQGFRQQGMTHQDAIRATLSEYHANDEDRREYKRRVSRRGLGLTELGPLAENPGGSVERISERSAKVITAKGHVDYPILHSDGTIAYDFPERVPEHLKKQVRKLFSRGAGANVPAYWIPEFPALSQAEKHFYMGQFDYWLNVEGAIEEKAKRYAWEDTLKKFPHLHEIDAPGLRENPRVEVVHGVNPPVEDIVQDFTGAPAEWIDVYNEPHIPRGRYAQLGPLIALYIKPAGGGQVRRIGAPERRSDDWQAYWNNDPPMIVTDSTARQIYFVAGAQDISDSLEAFGATDRGDGLVELGQGRRIDYEGSKKHVADPDEDQWKHDHGEENGQLPTVLFDTTNKRLIYEGGDYRIDGAWIRN